MGPLSGFLSFCLFFVFCFFKHQTRNGHENKHETLTTRGKVLGRTQPHHGTVTNTNTGNTGNTMLSVWNTNTGNTNTGNDAGEHEHGERRRRTRTRTRTKRAGGEGRGRTRAYNRQSKSSEVRQEPRGHR